MISLDIVPSTVRQAAELLANSFSSRSRLPRRCVTTFAGPIQHGWSLWEMNTPLQRGAIKHYAIAHPDDMSCLIVDWARAMVLYEEFFPAKHCKRFHEHWARFRTMSMEAAGWKKA